MPDAITTLPAYRSPAAPSSVTWLPALVPSCPEKGQAPVFKFLKTAAIRFTATPNRAIRRSYAMHPLCRSTST
mgnify:CR=1 FL=1